MKTSRFTDSQTLAILKQNEAGTSVHDLCREHGMSSASFYKWRGKPKALRCDNGPEYIGGDLIEWASDAQITLLSQKAYVERFNRTARNKLLELHLFDDLEHAQLLATQWQWTYNNKRPHSSICGVPPRKLL